MVIWKAGESHKNILGSSEKISMMVSAYTRNWRPTTKQKSHIIMKDNFRTADIVEAVFKSKIWCFQLKKLNRFMIIREWSVMSKTRLKREIFSQKNMGPNKFILDSSDMGLGVELEDFLKATISSMELF